MKCKTCNNVYVGQSESSINTRHKEHVRYTRTNNPLTAYALHILQNRHAYGTIADTLQLLKTRQKGTRTKCWDALYMPVFRQHKVLITEQQVSDTNPLYELASTTRILPRNPQPVSRNVTHYTHLQSGAFSTTQHRKHKPRFNPDSLSICI